jgi:ABC-type multidrug transport system ATPase subunit
MLLDEPEMGLDQQAISALWAGLQSGETRTIVLTTHNLERGLALSDRILILNRGRIVYEGSSRRLDVASLRELYQQSTGVEA